MTGAQYRLLTFLATSLSGGATPSFDEMARHMGLASKSGVHRLLTALQRDGFIHRRRGAVRHIEILRVPQTILGQCPCCGQTLPKAEAA